MATLGAASPVYRKAARESALTITAVEGRPIDEPGRRRTFTLTQRSSAVVFY